MRRVLLLAGLVAGFAMTLPGFLAAYFPPFEMINHFRPYTLMGSLALCAFALPQRIDRLAFFCIALLGINSWLFAQPFYAAAATVKSHDQTSLKLVTLNVWGHNKSLDDVANFLLAESADVVLLQETSDRHRQHLLPKLSSTYPHILACDCRNQVLLSKRPWLEAGSQKMTEDHPPLVWARFKSSDGRTFRVIGLHAAFPFRPWQQAAHYEWLIRELPKWTAEALVVAGDFNMSPWSYRLQKLAQASGLQRHGIWQRSWPGHLPLQFFLLDNVFSTPGVFAESFEIGTKVGSDHLPVVARLVLQ